MIDSVETRVPALPIGAAPASPHQELARCPADPLATSHLLPALGQKTASNAIVAAAAQGVRFCANLGLTIVLARLLMPADFGLVAMVTAVTGFLEVFKDAGLSTATIQRQDITPQQVSNLFWANLGIGVSMTFIVVLLAPLLAWFYQEPRLVPVAIVISVTFVLTGACVQHQAVLRRQMRFGPIAIIQVVASLLGTAVGIAMAMIGYGYWSLVGATVSAAAATLALSWLVCEWRPLGPARHVGTTSLLGFGAHLTGAALVQTVIGTADTLLIGRMYGANAVGLYTRGSALVVMPMQQFLSPIAAVLLPSLSRVQTDAVRYRRAFLEVLNLLCLVSLPAAGFLAGASGPLVHVILGEKWLSAVPIFAAFSVMAAYVPIAGAATWLFTTQGRGAETLSASVLVAILSLLAILAGLPFGAVGVAIGLSLSGITLRLPLLFHLAGRSGCVTAANLWGCLLRNLPLGAIAFGVCLIACRSLPESAAALQLAVCIPASFIAIAAFVAGSPAHRTVIKAGWRRLRQLRAGRNEVRDARHAAG